MGNAVLKCNETQKGVLFFFQNLVDLDIIFKNFLEIMKVPFWKMWQCKKNALNLKLSSNQGPYLENVAMQKKMHWT